MTTQPTDGRYPALHKKHDGWLFIGSNGDCRYLDFLWLEGAKIAYAMTTAKGWLAYHLWRLLPDALAFSRVGFKLLPSAGDWIYREQDGRCSSLAMFIDCELRVRASQEQPQ